VSLYFLHVSNFSIYKTLGLGSQLVRESDGNLGILVGVRPRETTNAGDIARAVDLWVVVAKPRLEGKTA
jgi:hypothetical protein